MLALSVPICALRVQYLYAVKPLLMMANEMKQRRQFEISTIAVIIGSATTASPEGIAHKSNGTVRVRAKGAQVELREMLDTNTGIANAFINFLTKEFSVENWKFYSEILQLRMTYGDWKELDAGLSGLDSGHLEWFKTRGPEIVALRERINRIYLCIWRSRRHLKLI